MSYTIEQLAVNHDYYCSTTNHYSNEARQSFQNFEEFANAWSIDDWEDSDTDMNLMFRFDIVDKEQHGYKGEGKALEMFFILQRKGIFFPVVVFDFQPKDIERFLDFAKKHWTKLKSIWKPISDAK